jgi:hypothetical protein
LPGGETVRRYLVVANQTLGGDALVQAVRERMLRGPSEFWVLVPATHPSYFADRVSPLAFDAEGAQAGGTPDGDASTLAQRQLEAELQRLHEAGATADGEVGDPDPIKAIGRTLARQQFEEIILSTLPPQRSRWLRQDLPGQIRKRFNIPLTHLVTPYSHW